MRKKKFLAGLLSVACIMMTGCNGSGTQEQSSETLDTATIEIRQNDYRGGVIRTQAISSAVLSVVETMKQNNLIVRQDQPNTFWSSDDYQDFVMNFLNSSLLNDTKLFNEEETDWSTIVSTIKTSSNSFYTSNGDGTYNAVYSNISFKRNEKDDYTISGLNNTNFTSFSILYGNYYDRILYDCDKDWCKAYTAVDISLDVPETTISTNLFEYRRITDDVFVIQTEKERLLVVYKPVGTESSSEMDASADSTESTENTETVSAETSESGAEETSKVADDGKATDIRNREIESFYYSKLMSGSIRTEFEPFTLKSEYTEDGSVDSSAVKYNSTLQEIASVINAKGEVSDRYNAKNSVFFMDSGVAEDGTVDLQQWIDFVLEDGSQSQILVYEDGVLSVTTYNKLNEQYEQFTYYVSGKTDEQVEAVVNITDTDKLVGKNNKITLYEEGFTAVDETEEEPTVEEDETSGDEETDTGYEEEPEETTSDEETASSTEEETSSSTAHESTSETETSAPKSSEAAK
jgi:hypothetical protein